ncbi:MAG: D-alanyl-D-alanine carboxypeptidase/D-alanyl-D-alanine-endopeptidase [Porphyromonas sp.]|nr:D-alanyl-D-alanine carboxypeptidase/D-alanyl-D-alanine-endopeptidase [Porphyromonas sp.]
MMNTTMRKTLLLFIILPLAVIQNSAQTLGTPRSDSALEETFWGLSVQDATTGEELVGVRSHHLMTPASTMKVVSTATALSMLSPSTRIPTEVLTDGQISGNTLKGNLWIIGHGDPSIGSRYLWGKDQEQFFKEVVSALRTKQISTIEGDIIAYIPESDFQGLNPHWPAYDMGNHYAAGAFALNVYDNSYSIHFTDFGQNFYTDPEVPDLKLTARYGFTRERSSDSLYVSPFPLADTSYPITGVYPVNVPKLRIRASIPNPPLFFTQETMRVLEKGGISVSGAATTSWQEPSAPSTLHVYLSPTLYELARTTNIYSHNLFAESLLRLVGRDRTPLPGHNGTQTSIMALREYWAGRGLNMRELEMRDGSGLSPEDRVTPYFLAAILGKAYRGDPSHALMRTMPLAGKEGTLTIFLKNTPLEGKALLKSGSIRNVICYTGYVEHKGKVYTMALMVNNFYGRSSNVRKAMEQILLDVFN